MDELRARVADITADVDFVTAAGRLRPKLNGVIKWQPRNEAHDLVQDFLNAKESRPDRLYGLLLTRLMAAFERFLRGLVGDMVATRSKKSKTFDGLPHKLRRANIRLTGQLLAGIDNPRDHISLDIDELAANLASCRSGSTDFILNAVAFSAAISGSGPDTLDKAVDPFDLPSLWDRVGTSARLQRILGTKTARSTGKRASERLKDLWRRRNQLAHGGDEDPSVSEGQLREAIEFVQDLATQLVAVTR